MIDMIDMSEKRFLPVCVFRNGTHEYDCTNNGVTSPSRKVELFVESQRGQYSINDLTDFVKSGYEISVLYKDKVKFAGEEHIHLKPYDIESKDGELQFFRPTKHYMFGGNFIWSSDSRFSEISKYPVPVHDRNE